MKRIPTCVFLAGLNCLFSPFLHAQTTYTRNFHYTDSIATWTAPFSGVYGITAYGAQGGNAGQHADQQGGYGAQISGSFLLNSGEILSILVGSQGALNNNSHGGGGGGGTFVVAPSNTPLVVAGGGGGAAHHVDDSRNASTNTSGNNAYYHGSNKQGSGGTDGSGGTIGSDSGVDGGAGGGGFFGDGGTHYGLHSHTDEMWAVGGSSYVSGGAGGSGGGSGSLYVANGGFGGGGQGGVWGGGGGGGYSGGGGGYQHNTVGGSGGGGGSFIAASATNVTMSVTNTGNGLATISYVTFDLLLGFSGSGQTASFTSGAEAYTNVLVGVDAIYVNNRLTVADAGTLLTSASNIVVGVSGSGNSMVISNGGTVVTSPGIYTGVTNGGVIGYNAGASINTVTVTGSGSAWSNAYDVVVGYNGSGNSLVVSNGGMVTAGNTAYSATVGYGATSSNNVVTVTGSGSIFSNSAAIVGVFGDGNRMVISNGGKVVSGETGSYIGSGDTSTGNSVVVTGSGSAWEIDSFLFVGSDGSGSTLTVSDGGNVTAAAVELGYLAGSSGNSVVVSGGGSISSSSTYIGRAGNNNSVLVTGSGSTWSNHASFGGASPLYIGFGGTNNSLTVADGGNVAASQATIAGSSGVLNIGRFGTNDAAGTISTPTITFGTGTGTINFNQSNSTTISAAISGNGSVNQLGSGTTTLTGHNTYSGATTVAAGDLVVNGSIANSMVTVQSGGTLAGSGSVGGIVLNVGSTINPGNSPGTLNVTGNIVWNAGANYNWQIHDTALAAGTGWDLVNATGTLDLSALTVGSEFNINLWSLSGVTPDVNGSALNFNPNQSYTWTILTAAGGISGFTGSNQFVINTGAINGTGGFANALNGGSFSVAQSLNGKNLNLVFTAAGGPGGPSPVPEPGTWAAAALLAGAAGYVRWRRRNKASR